LAALGRLAGSTTPLDLWAGLAQGSVGQRLERLVQQPELADDWGEVVPAVESAVQAVHLGREPVEALEQCIELAIADVFR
jgi:hypothetical protein